ncbi:lysophospholipid acyltransferase family protein [Saccharopolyspora rectivirgula]|uniref:Acyl-phosphate glycerol 3-phosphate acyltransferase n=1 Tax=Saccharopolyspora rectivirgula TaxID=28042 RepID=A0A073B5W8_9PSEU|nr:lysophospholipid acyltransferase family protein [Saccharopolyspora rectivirgula]KEI43024.1 acyl-phosphate glycerol 3-phosphate acyltransferase [Saccharopolyspora rectivirgula]MDD6790790.1 lysophospholipid acyltransferase family protein [Thermobifida fusca]
MTEPRSLRRQRKQTCETVHGSGKLWLGLARTTFYPITGALGRTRVSGMSNIPATGPALLVMNHVSHLDPVYDAVTVHRAGRIPRFLAKNTLWDVPVLRNIMLGTGQIPVFRGTSDAQKSLREAHRGLADGKVILIYPEGTITKDPAGWPMTPKVGVARLALSNDVPVVPAARWGTRDIYDHYQKKFQPFPRKEVTIKFGEPVDLSSYRGKGKEEDKGTLQEVTRLLMLRVRELLAEIRGEQPPAEFFDPRNAKRSGNGAA